MTSDLFLHQPEPDRIQKLTEEVSAYTLRISPDHVPSSSDHVPSSSDKWVLASNLQKSIRRGLTETAAGTAIKLLSVDERYFWRRLLVIAYEDVGYGNIQLCFDLLKSFRREAMHRQLGAERVAAYFATALSNACKSRALCDGIAMLEFNVQLGKFEQHCFGLTDSQLIDVICDENESQMIRVAALRHICGYHVYANGSYRTITPARPELMREVCRQLDLTKMETALFLSGQSASESLNIPLPLVATLTRGEKSEVRAEQVYEGKNGILFAAFDRHTRAGKRCFAQLVRDVPQVRTFFDNRPALNPVDVLGVSVFIVEGSLLNRWVVFPQSDILRLTFEHNVLEHFGVTGECASELLSLTCESLTMLNQVRAEVLK